MRLVCRHTCINLKYGYIGWLFFIIHHIQGQHAWFFTNSSFSVFFYSSLIVIQLSTVNQNLAIRT